jgi:hypothetical protein
MDLDKAALLKKLRKMEETASKQQRDINELIVQLDDPKTKAELRKHLRDTCKARPEDLEREAKRIREKGW